MFDQTVGRQRADVFVDEQPVGAWYSPGKNGHHAWREDELFVPAALTAGKSKIDVRVVFVSSDLDWNEFEYRAYSRLR